MWIRSQNKDVLVNADNVCFYKSETVDGLGSAYEFRHYEDGKNYYILGEYSTKEKALKVMEMIQGCITGNRLSNYEIVCDCPVAGVEYHGVFTMPNDKKVKENE